MRRVEVCFLSTYEKKIIIGPQNEALFTNNCWLPRKLRVELWIIF